MHLPHETTVVDIACGEEHAALLTSQGQVFTWGFGNDGQLGHRNRNSINSPKKLAFEEPVGSVKCGGGHTGVVTKGGELYLFGRGRDGQLGRGDEVESMAAFRTEPNKVEYFNKNGLRVVDVTLGTNHSIALVKKNS